jgi:NifU-like protein
MTGGPADRLICRCFVVPEDVIRRAIHEHDLHQVEEITACTRAGGGCSSCYDDIQAILCEVRGKPLPPNVPDASGLSSAQKRAAVARLLSEDAGRLLDLNGIQAQLVDVGGERVLVRFSGERVGTPAASFLALKHYLVRRMAEACGQKMTLIELNVLEDLARTR